MSGNGEEPELIECKTCKRQWAPSGYYAGNRSTCKECIKRNYREWYQANKEQKTESVQAWRDRVKRGEPGNMRRARRTWQYAAPENE